MPKEEIKTPPTPEQTPDKWSEEQQAALAQTYIHIGQHIRKTPPPTCTTEQIETATQRLNHTPQTPNQPNPTPTTTRPPTPPKQQKENPNTKTKTKPNYREILTLPENPLPPSIFNMLLEEFEGRQ